jgi:hypothetical protein
MTGGLATRLPTGTEVAPADKVVASRKRASVATQHRGPQSARPAIAGFT